MCGAYLRCLSLELEVEIGELENGIGRVESSFLQVAVYKQLGGWKLWYLTSVFPDGHSDDISESLDDIIQSRVYDGFLLLSCGLLMWLDGIFVAPMRSRTLHVLLVFVVLDSFHARMVCHAVAHQG
jgi:hypothetical protein